MSNQRAVPLGKLTYIKESKYGLANEITCLDLPKTSIKEGAFSKDLQPSKTLMPVITVESG